MSTSGYKATKKMNIEPVEITLKVVASRINENGTFSSFKVKSISGPNSATKVAVPPMGGGSIFLQTESLEGINEVEGGTEQKAEKQKLF